MTLVASPMDEHGETKEDALKMNQRNIIEIIFKCVNIVLGVVQINLFFYE